MGYHSEQHLLCGAPKARATEQLLGHAERQSGDNARLGLRGRLLDEPQYRYFATDGEARRAAKGLAERYFINRQYWNNREERWL